MDVGAEGDEDSEVLGEMWKEKGGDGHIQRPSEVYSGYEGYLSSIASSKYVAGR